MNKGFSQEEIEKIDKMAAQAGQSFVFQEEAERSEDFASIFFTGIYKGKKVVFDAFVYTLEMEFISNIYDAAKDAVLEENPEYEGLDFDEDEGEHVELMEEFATELARDEDFQVCEYIDFDEDVTYGVSMDICLNMPEITTEVIEDFVSRYQQGTYQADKTFYAFDWEEGES